MAYTTINKSTAHFNTKLYTGTGSTNNITGVGFQPDWTWIKQRDGTGNHRIYDAVRGATKTLYSNLSNEQGTNTNGLSSFDSDGFTVNTNSQSNGNGNTFVSWNWKAGGGQGSSNTDGSINTTYTSANTTAGFSISQYTGTSSAGTIGHGLGVAPKMVIVKSLSNTTAWMVYHASLGNAQEIYLNGTNASSSSTAWNSTTPTSTVVSLGGGSGDGVNYSGNYVAYCFAEKKGFSKFGSYTGNGNADGAFVYTGFKPAFVMVKRTDSTGAWVMHDAKRNPINPTDKDLEADTNSAEVTTTRHDFLSNGFKLRTSTVYVNANGGSYIYMAFAEEPLVSSNNIPATAR